MPAGNVGHLKGVAFAGLDDFSQYSNLVDKIETLFLIT